MLYYLVLNIGKYYPKGMMGPWFLACGNSSNIKRWGLWKKSLPRRAILQWLPCYWTREEACVSLKLPPWPCKDWLSLLSPRALCAQIPKVRTRRFSSYTQETLRKLQSSTPLGYKRRQWQLHQIWYWVWRTMWIYTVLYPFYYWNKIYQV